LREKEREGEVDSRSKDPQILNLPEDILLPPPGRSTSLQTLPTPSPTLLRSFLPLPEEVVDLMLENEPPRSCRTANGDVEGVAEQVAVRVGLKR